MIRKDDRTPEQVKTHRWAVVALDRFMSGWGGAADGTSRCAWAVPDEWLSDGSIEAVERWVRGRSEMKYVNIVELAGYRPRAAHFHIYVCDDSHPGAPQWRQRRIREQKADEAARAVGIDPTMLTPARP